MAGWFSFEHMGATAGDLLCRDVACNWLLRAGHDHDVALAPPFTGGVDWRTVEPSGYSQVVFVCGPFGNGRPVSEFLERFDHCRLVGLNLSMLDSLENWNPFHLLLERDSTGATRPDISFVSRPASVPVVGVVLVHRQKEYKNTLNSDAERAIERLVASRPMSVVPIDTRLDANSTGLRTPAEIESLIARMDLVVTTRLHGAVLAIKNGVPAIAIDPVQGGAKVARQLGAIGWPVTFTADSVTDDALRDAFEYCRTDEARRDARACAARAAAEVTRTGEAFVAALTAMPSRA